MFIYKNQVSAETYISLLIIKCLLACSDLVTLNKECLSSLVVRLILIFTKILHSVPYRGVTPFGQG